MTPSRDPFRATPSCYASLRAILPAAMKQRCWAGSDDPLMLAYHDREWAVPLHGDQELFAKLVLDGFQAGLSWRVILHKRARFLEAFDGFDPERMARYDRKKMAQLLKDPGIVRNRQKVAAAVSTRTPFSSSPSARDPSGGFSGASWGVSPSRTGAARCASCRRGRVNPTP